MHAPDDTMERMALERGARVVVGVDEVGRGPLAGPVVAAAVWLLPGRAPVGLRDSKVLTAARRISLDTELRAVAKVGLGSASVAEIDAMNILRASHLAMIRAIAALPVTPDHLLVDGNMLPPGLTCGAEAVVKGDARCVSIAAASIVAKVARDAIMVDLAQQWPGYGWEANAGYAVAMHLSALETIGVSPHHRRSFRPVHKILYQDKE